MEPKFSAVSSLRTDVTATVADSITSILDQAWKANGHQR